MGNYVNTPTAEISTNSTESGAAIEDPPSRPVIYDIDDSGSEDPAIDENASFEAHEDPAIDDSTSFEAHAADTEHPAFAADTEHPAFVTDDDPNVPAAAASTDADEPEAAAARADADVPFEDTLDYKLREAGLLKQLIDDRGKKTANTTFRRVVKFFKHSGCNLIRDSIKNSSSLLFFEGLTTCAKVEDIPNLLISLTPGAITEYPVYLESAMQKPSTACFLLQYLICSLITFPLLHTRRYIMSLERSSMRMSGYGTLFLLARGRRYDLLRKRNC